MFRAHYIVWAAALGLALWLTPASQAQKHSGSNSQSHSSGSHAHSSGSQIHSSGAAMHHGNYAPTRANGGTYYAAGHSNWSPGNRVYGYNLNRSYYDHDRGYHHRGYFGPWFGYGLANYGGGYYGTGYYGGLFAPYNDYSNSYYYSPYDYGGGYAPALDYYRGGLTVPAPAPTIAKIEVLLPDPDAQVWFDGKATTTRGSTRDYDTPSLKPGTAYSYTVRATWNQGGKIMTAEQVVPFSTGSHMVVDFTQNPPKVGPNR